jgi:FMN phosphatase YigB (HAD superfamily)
MLVKRIKTVLFDLGNVLVHIDPDAFWRNLGFTRPEEASPFAESYASWIRQYETGYIAGTDFLNGLCNIFNKRFTIGRLEAAFSGIIQEPVAGMNEIVRRISSTNQTALASNTSEIHYNASRMKCETLMLLHKSYLSYQLHSMKPAGDFYEAIIRDRGAAPAELLFIDDNAENVNAAKSAGMQGIHFKNTRLLKIALHSINLL